MKRNSTKYIVCPICGSNLDFGEKCDCENTVIEQETKENERKNSVNKLALALGHRK